VVLGLGASGRLTNNSELTLRVLTLVVATTVILFYVRGILATIRDGVSLTRSLEEIKGLTPLGKNIRDSSTSLIITGFTVSFFAPLTLMLLSFYLFKK
jgi:hypothetical protein